MRYQLNNAFVVNATSEAAWAFFSTAENLPKITPPQMGFHIVTPRPIVLQRDSIIDYTIRVSGFPVKWRTRIVNWEPPTRFIDLQERGPYKLWHHEHTFQAVDGGVRCRDRVIYEIPLGVLGTIAQHVMVKRQLLEIFNYRKAVIERELGAIRIVEQPNVRRFKE